MQIRKMDPAHHRDAHLFIEFPFKLYKDCPQWVPALESDMNLVLDRQRHPFYRHSEADFFLAESGGEVLGRIAVLHNTLYSAHHDQPTAFFYYFDCVDDLEVSGGLFAATQDWSQQRNLSLMLGSKGFSRSSGLGVLVEGFEYPPAIGIPYNFPYQKRLVEGAGFVKETDHLSGFMDRRQSLPEKILGMAEKVKQRRHFWIKTFRDKAEMRRWIPVVDRVHQEAFQNNPGFYPSTPEEFELLANSMIQIADPRLIKLIMYDEEVAGFVLAYADISSGIRRAHGRMWPFGWIYLLWDMRHTRLVDLNGVGLLPKYQGLGSNALLYTELDRTLRDFRFERAEFIQIDERNFKSRADMETAGVTWCIRHRTYRKEL